MYLYTHTHHIIGKSRSDSRNKVCEEALTQPLGGPAAVSHQAYLGSKVTDVKLSRLGQCAFGTSNAMKFIIRNLLQ